jgi:murein DD-endopeptidase MepM/ murein hydrolase activator NlpD
MLIRVLAAAAFFGLFVASASAREPTLEIRFHPAGRVHAYPLDSLRGYSAVVVQNTAVINRGTTPVTLVTVEFELLSGDQALDARHLVPADIARSAASGSGLQSSGLLSLLAFQFGGDALLGGATLAKSVTLAPGEAILFGHQLLSFKGERDALRVRIAGTADGTAVEGGGTLPVRAAASRVAYRFPLNGTWFVGAGPSPHSHHRWVVSQEFAYDILKLGADGSTHSGNGTKRQQYHAYGAPVLAAADGRVVAAVHDQPENDDDLRRPGENAVAYLARVKSKQGERLSKGVVSVIGNHVVLEHAHGEHSVYAHLRPGSLTVKRGDVVKAGQRLGRLGTSGNSTEPHLHFHVCDGPDPLSCAGVPVQFADIELPLADLPRPIQSGDMVTSR